jgi:LuxR family quorum-sensing system transcriptional regulator CciR
MFERIGAFIEDASAVNNEAELTSILAAIARELGFAYFALTTHLSQRTSPTGAAIRIHNYPGEWERHYDDQQLGRTDPVHRACQVTAVGFAWSKLPTIIQLTPNDRRMLEAAALQGLGEGYSVPAHVPGEVNGSCSFATARGTPLAAEHLASAQLVGTFAFEAVRRLQRRQNDRLAGPPHVSNRERDCLIWVARGKSDPEIATILGLSPETVRQYVKQARANHDVVSRSQLVAHALFTGTISFMDIFKR